MGTYLEQYLESVSSLPADLNRKFQLMRELDTRAQGFVAKIDTNSKVYFQQAKKARKERGKPPDEKLLKEIESDQKACLDLGDEKVALAVQTYELVDQHIRKLDEDLTLFEKELMKLHPDGDNKKIARTMIKKRDVVNADVPVDPSEPVYCYCQKVSFGEMIGCDNDDCRLEWFHLACVGISAPPVGRWYCLECTEKLGAPENNKKNKKNK